MYEKYERGAFMASGKHILAKQGSQRVFGTAKVGDRGQIVIPKEARELFNIRPGDTLLILGEERKGLIVSRPELLSDLADKVFDSEEKEA
jgi:AbrB family looped-hinge helix DNA binding protein